MTSTFRSAFRYGIWFGGLALVSLSLKGWAQSLPSLQDLRGTKAIGLEKIAGTRGVAAMDRVFFEGPINPDEYVVGPGDQLSVLFWQPTYNEVTCYVTAEGDALIPYVGSIRVSDMTLTAAKRAIQTQVSKMLTSGQVTVSLIQPRSFRVHVAGLVEAPGSYSVSATMRVADVIRMAGGMKRKVTFAGGDTASVSLCSERRVEIVSRTGAVEGFADLLRFDKSGNPAANPYLRDGHVIRVLPKDESATRVGIFGAVGQSGLFDYVAGDNVAVLLELAGGLSRNADSSSLLVAGENGRQITVNLRSGSNPLLQAGDRVYVGAFPDTGKSGSVVLSGELARPGGYPIRVGETTLKDVLTQAGGFLSTAAVNSVRLIRKPKVDPVQTERTRILNASFLRDSRNLPTHLDNQLAAEFLRWDYGTVVLDLSDLASNQNGAAATKLLDGDVLDVPSAPLGVRVLGGVNQAGEVAWQAGKSLNDYLNQAGGVNRSGWKKRAIILKARNGSQLRYQNSLPIDPGDVIFVPARNEISGWDQFKDFIAVAAQVVTVVFVVQNVGK